MLPGLMLVLLFMGYVVLWALWHPGKTETDFTPLGLLKRLYHARRLLPVAARG